MPKSSARKRTIISTGTPGCLRRVLKRQGASVLLGMALLAPGLAAAASSPANPQTLNARQAREQREERAAERAQLRERLNTLRRAIAAGEAVRSEAADELAESERAISDANRQLRELDTQQRNIQTELEVISARQRQTQEQVATRQTQLSQLLRSQYQAGAQDPFKLLFSGANPNLIQRDLQYLAYLARAETEVLEGLNTNLAELREMAEEVRLRDAELAKIAVEQQAQRDTLVKTQQTRRQLLARMSEKLRGQRLEAGALERNEKRLARVVEELARVIERQAREARQREQSRRRQAELAREKEAREARQARSGGMARQSTDRARAPAEKSGPSGSAEGKVDSTGETGVVAGAYGDFAGSFAKLKGRLRLPLQGDLTARYGSGRPEGGPSWKGLFIRARQGSEVRSVAPGRVVFAEWLRGFGNLLIVDHGDDYLSIYGNNETLLKEPGDMVKTGDPLAAAGNSGGNPETGLYFELRHKGRPFDPMSWVR